MDHDRELLDLVHHCSNTQPTQPPPSKKRKFCDISNSCPTQEDNTSQGQNQSYPFQNGYSNASCKMASKRRKLNYFEED
jgi:hypothetical protein